MLRVARIFKVLTQTVRSMLRVRKAYAADHRAEIHEISQHWAREVLEAVGVTVTVTGAPLCAEPCIFVANHMSYLDIPCFFTHQTGTFVAKKEVRSWPLFGIAAEAAGTIFVDRGSAASSRSVAQSIVRAVGEEKRNVIVFPEGTTSIEGKPWKRGVFGVARDKGYWVQAFRISYRPARLAAFIDDDSLHTHLWKLVGNAKVEAQLEFFPATKIIDLEADTKRLQDLVHTSLRAELERK